MRVIVNQARRRRSPGGRGRSRVGVGQPLLEDSRGQSRVERGRLLLFTLAFFILAGAASADSLFTPAVAKAGTLASEQTARFKEGDIITVLIRETVDASTQADLRTKKQSDIESKADSGSNQFLVADQPNGLGLLNAEQLPNWKVESENETRDTGQTVRRNTLTTSISAVVAKVYENGNILLEGSKQVTVNREDTNLVISGVVRSKDVTPQNTVLSTQMVNSVVKLQGKGPLWNNTRRGLLTRLLDWFSPN